MTLSDGEWAQRADTWGVVVLSVIVAVLFPVVTWRKSAQEDLLREKVLHSPRGGVLTGVSVLSAVLVVAGAPFVFLATRYAFVWVAVALVASALLSVLIYAVRYVRVRRLMEREIAREQALPTADREP
ncbi:hypothetical protein [Microbacterium thalli]|uniref:hypothetical protein n=1 Tax=Microbacterium thalli TaxID=3027921 RepID=UPI0023662638|nr:hypothetical protein [Microbacterium thalli]MDD7928545.1 hypothetical protein [Microbacterium thalli]